MAGKPTYILLSRDTFIVLSEAQVTLRVGDIQEYFNTGFRNIETIQQEGIVAGYSVDFLDKALRIPGERKLGGVLAGVIIKIESIDYLLPGLIIPVTLNNLLL